MWLENEEMVLIDGMLELGEDYQLDSEPLRLVWRGEVKSGWNFEFFFSWFVSPTQLTVLSVKTVCLMLGFEWDDGLRWFLDSQHHPGPQSTILFSLCFLPQDCCSVFEHDDGYPFLWIVYIKLTTESPNNRNLNSNWKLPLPKRGLFLFVFSHQFNPPPYIPRNRDFSDDPSNFTITFQLSPFSSTFSHSQFFILSITFISLLYHIFTISPPQSWPSSTTQFSSPSFLASDQPMSVNPDQKPSWSTVCFQPTFVFIPTIDHTTICFFHNLLISYYKHLLNPFASPHYLVCFLSRCIRLLYCNLGWLLCSWRFLRYVFSNLFFLISLPYLPIDFNAYITPFLS